MKTLILSLIVAASFATDAFANCLQDKGPYQDNAGFANFPFANQCDQNVMVSLCVRTSAGGETIFTPYNIVVGRLNTSTITAGKWSMFDSYRWSEDQRQACPFY